MSSHRLAPTTPFPPLPDELDDAVYDAYLTFVAANLRGWRRPARTSRASSLQGVEEGSTPPTPALTTAPSTPDRSVRSSPPTTPFPTTSRCTPVIPQRSSSLQLVRASPPNPTLKHRISAPMPLRSSFERSSNASNDSLLSTASTVCPSTPPSSWYLSSSSPLSHSRSTSSLYASVQAADYDPFVAAFEQNLAKPKSFLCQDFDLPDLPLQPPDIWRRGSNSSSASSTLPSIKEVNENRRPVERVWW